MKHRLPLLLTALLAVSCGSKSSSPSSPGGSGSGGGNSSLTAPLLEATLEDNNGTIGADVNIASSTGAVTNAAVTLSNASIGNVVVAYVGSNATLPVSINGGLSDITFGIYQATGWTYTASQPYTVTANVGGTPYTANITAVGSVTIHSGGSGMPVTCSWVNAISTASTNPQNISQFSAKNSSYATFFTDPSPAQAPFLSSPVTIPASSLSGATTVTMDTGTVKTGAFPGSFAASFIESNCEAQTAY
jgi:hypothetical protein